MSNNNVSFSSINLSQQYLSNLIQQPIDTSNGQCVHQSIVGWTNDIDPEKSFSLFLAVYSDYDIMTKQRLSLLAIGGKYKIKLLSVDLGFGCVYDPGLEYLVELIGKVHIDVLDIVFNNLNDLKGNTEKDYITLMEMLMLDKYYSDTIKSSYSIVKFLQENEQYEVIV